jgi:hypothetical protein
LTQLQSRQLGKWNPDDSSTGTTDQTQQNALDGICVYDLANLAVFMRLGIYRGQSDDYHQWINGADVGARYGLVVYHCR